MATPFLLKTLCPTAMPPSAIDTVPIAKPPLAAFARLPKAIDPSSTLLVP